MLQFLCRHTTFYKPFQCLFNTIWYVSIKRDRIKGHKSGGGKACLMLVACFSAMAGESLTSFFFLVVIVGTEVLLMHDGKRYEFTILI